MKIKHFVMFSLILVIVYTIVCTIITTITCVDLSTYYTIFCGVFGGECVCTCILKIFTDKEKKKDIEEGDDSVVG